MLVHAEAIAAAKAGRQQQVPVDGDLVQEANCGQAFVARKAVREGGAARLAALPLTMTVTPQSTCLILVHGPVQHTWEAGTAVFALSG